MHLAEVQAHSKYFSQLALVVNQQAGKKYTYCNIIKILPPLGLLIFNMANIWHDADIK